jgi:hypothetical protein
VNDGASNPGDAFIAGNLTVGGALTVTGFGPHIISGNAPGFLSMQVRNTYPTGGSQFVLGNDLNFARTIVQSQGSGFASNGALIADGSLLAASGNGGLSVQAAGAGAGAAIRFYTAGNTQRLTILSTGEVLIAAAANVGPGTLCVQADTPHLGLTVSDQSAAQNQTLVGCFNSAGTFSGGIQHSGPTSVVYTTSSDARLKTDDGRASDLAALRAVVVHDFTWKADGVRDRGIFAQEAAALYPRAVTVGTDETTAAGSLARPWQTDYSKFVADLIVGWQQHDAELADLRARLAPQGAA